MVPNHSLAARRFSARAELTNLGIRSFENFRCKLTELLDRIENQGARDGVQGISPGDYESARNLFFLGQLVFAPTPPPGGPQRFRPYLTPLDGRERRQLSGLDRRARELHLT